MALRSTGQSSSPSRQDCSLSLAKTWFRPSIPASTIATHSIPGPAGPISPRSRSKAKLKMTSTSSAKTQVALATSLLRSSARMSLPTRAQTWPRKARRLVSGRGADMATVGFFKGSSIKLFPGRLEYDAPLRKDGYAGCHVQAPLQVVTGEQDGTARLRGVPQHAVQD